MPDDQPGSLKLCQPPVYRRKPNVLAGVTKPLVEILGTEVIALS